MSAGRIAAFLLVTLVMASCVFVPEKAVKQKYSNECKMFTKKLTLTAIEDHLSCAGVHNNNAEACLLIYGVVVPLGSFVISGGIVLTNNTLHWLEYQGTCDEGILLKSVDKLKRTF